MAKLADVTYQIRTILKVLAASFAVILILFLVFRGGQLFKNTFFPSPLPPPDEKFGHLAQISFPTQSQKTFEYRINTLTGKLPDFPDRMKVYKVLSEKPSLVALDSTRNLLKNTGFYQGETKISDSTYQWSNPLGSLIQLNLITKDFKISSNFLSSPPALLSGGVQTKEGAFLSTTTFLEAIGEDIRDIDVNKSNVQYLKIDNGILVDAGSLNNAQFIRLDLFQKDVNNYSIYYPDNSSSTMHFIYKNQNDGASIVEANYFHYAIDANEFSDYAIKNADQAFSDLSNGNALVFNNSPNSNPVDITDVLLGYYIGEENQEYFLPIIVFVGNNFKAYVNAIP